MIAEDIACEVCEGTGVLEGSNGPDVCRFCRPEGTFVLLVEKFTRAKRRLASPRTANPRAKP